MSGFVLGLGSCVWASDSRLKVDGMGLLFQVWDRALCLVFVLCRVLDRGLSVRIVLYVHICFVDLGLG